MKTWHDLFDVVVTNADKPNFFTQHDRPFRQLNEKRDGLLWAPIENFERGEIYRDGCLTVRFILFFNFVS